MTKISIGEAFQKLKMFRKSLILLPILGVFGLSLVSSPYVSSSAEAQSRSKAKTSKKSSRKARRPARKSRRATTNSRKKAQRRSSRRPAKTAARTNSGPKPNLVATFGSWGAYVARGRVKTCYAMAQPSKRLPARLNRDPGYIFISSRPKEGMRNEISVIMGYKVKPGTEPELEIGSDKFVMVAKGVNLWVRNAAREAPMLAAMRKGSSLKIHVTSLRGNKTIDQYSLSGVTQALQRVRKECR